MIRFLTSILLLLQFVGFSQTYKESDNNFEKFLEVGGDVLARPTNFNSDDWLKLTAALGISGLSSLIDKEIKDFSQAARSDIANHLFTIDKYYHIESMAISIVAVYGYGALAQDENFKNLGLRLTEATIYSGLVNLAAKFLIGRSRPTISDDQYAFDPFSLSYDHTAFPSGHTTLAFAYSTVMSEEYNGFLWKLGWYSLAVMVGYARIYNNQHWFSDVVLGAVLGYFIAEYVISHHSNRKINEIGTAQPQQIISIRIPLKQ